MIKTVGISSYKKIATQEYEISLAEPIETLSAYRLVTQKEIEKFETALDLQTKNALGAISELAESKKKLESYRLRYG